MIRRLIALASAGLLVLLVAAPALAGGWAEIKADAAGTTEPPIEGQPTVIGFTVLQHGMTPAGWVHPTVHLQDIASGQTQEVAATGEGVDGHFVASVVLPTAGFWSWSVSMPELIVEGGPTTLAVLTAAGVAPTTDAATTMTAIEQAKLDAARNAEEALSPQIQRLDGLMSLHQAQIGQLQTQVTSITDERDALAARLAEAEAGTSGLPVLGIVLIALLAGATAGFAMAWVGSRSTTPRELELSPSSPSSSSASSGSSQRGSTPA
jgi:hypothetical protein